MNRNFRNPVPPTVECSLTLVARDLPENFSGDSEHSDVGANEKPLREHPSGQATVDPINSRGQREVGAGATFLSEVAKPSLSREINDSQALALVAEYEQGQQSRDPRTQQGAFWPFNRRDLSVDFSATLGSVGARFVSFEIRAPVGQIKGRRSNKE